MMIDIYKNHILNLLRYLVMIDPSIISAKSIKKYRFHFLTIVIIEKHQ